MGAILVNLTPLVWGVAEPKPLSHAVDGKVRYRMRGDEFARAIVRGPDGHCRWALIHDEGATWRLDFDYAPDGGGRNLATENRQLRDQVNVLQAEVACLNRTLAMLNGY